MALKKYRCLNVGNCTLADRRDSAYFSFGLADPRCRNCGRPLEEVLGRKATDTAGSACVRRKVMVLGALGVAAVAGSYLAFLR